MRTYGRIKNVDGTKSWVVVQTDADGRNDYVYVTALAQAILLNLNESPFYSDWGLPAPQSVIQQVQPDLYVSRTQARFAPFFAGLLIAKIPGPAPSYKINVTTQQGVRMNFNVYPNGQLPQ